MKKVIYAVLLSIVLLGSVSSCTDENVQPTTQESGGGGGIDPK